MIEENEKRPIVGVGVTVFAALCLLALLAAIALPSFIHPRGTSHQNSCINNLRQIDAGKEQAALAQGWGAEVDCDIPANAALVNCYITGNTKPVCPARHCRRCAGPWWRRRKQAPYTYGKVGVNPRCSYSGATTHKLKDS